MSFALLRQFYADFAVPPDLRSLAPLPGAPAQATANV